MNKTIEQNQEITFDNKELVAQTANEVRTISEKEQKTKAYYNALAANTINRYLEENGILTRDTVNLHHSSKLLNDFEVADVQLPNLHIDVRLVFDENLIFIPQKHFEYKILPDIYLIVKYNETAKNLIVLGYIKPEQINRQNKNDEYYFVNRSVLTPANELINLINSTPNKTPYIMSDTSEKSLEKLIMLYMDNDIENIKMIKMLDYLKNSEIAREKLVEFEHFERLSYLALQEFKGLNIEDNDFSKYIKSLIKIDEFSQFEKEDLDVLFDNDEVNTATGLFIDEAVDSAVNFAGSVMGGIAGGMLAGSATNALDTVKDAANIALNSVNDLALGENLPVIDEESLPLVKANIADPISEETLKTEDLDETFQNEDVLDTENLLPNGNEFSFFKDETEEETEEQDAESNSADTNDNEENREEDESDEEVATENNEVSDEIATLDEFSEENIELESVEVENLEIDNVTTDIDENLEEQTETTENTEETVLAETTEAELELNEEISLETEELPTLEENLELSDVTEDLELEPSEEVVELETIDEIKEEVTEVPSLDLDTIEEINLEETETVKESSEILDEVVLDEEINIQTEELENLSEIDAVEEISLEVDNSDKTEEITDVVANIDKSESVEVSPLNTEEQDLVEEVLDTTVDEAPLELEDLDLSENSEEDNIEPLELEDISEKQEEENFVSVTDEEIDDAINSVPEENKVLDDSTELPDFDFLEEQAEEIEEEKEVVSMSAGLEESLNVNFPAESSNNLEELTQSEHAYNAEESDFSYALDSKKPKKSNKALIATAATVALLGIAGAGAWFLLSQKPAANNIDIDIVDAGSKDVGEIDMNDIKADADITPAENEAPKADIQLPAEKPSKDIGAEPETLSIQKIKKDFSQPNTYLQVSKLVWDVPEYLTYNDDFNTYLQTLGSSIKLNLSSDLLLIKENPLFNKIKIKISLKNSGQNYSAEIVGSSGVNAVDDVVLQTVKNTLNAMKPPTNSLDTADEDLYITICL